MAKSGDPTTPAPNPNMQLSKDELDRVTEVFKMYETGLREATIYPKVREYRMAKLMLQKLWILRFPLIYQIMIYFKISLQQADIIKNSHKNNYHYDIILIHVTC